MGMFMNKQSVGGKITSFIGFVQRLVLVSKYEGNTKVDDFMNKLRFIINSEGSDSILL